MSMSDIQNGYIHELFSPQGADSFFLFGIIHGAAYIEVFEVKQRNRKRLRERGVVAVDRNKEIRASVISWCLESCFFMYQGG